MAQQMPNVVDLDHLLQAIRAGLLLHPAHAGSVRIVIESEAGEPLHVVKVDARCPPASEAAVPRFRPAPFAEMTAASSSVQQRDAPEQALLLLQQCKEQQQRITELEQQLQQMQQQLLPHARPPSPAHRVPHSPASSTDEDSSHSSDSPCRSDEDDDHEPSSDTVAMMDDADDAPSSSSPCPQAPDISTAVRKSERSKTNVDRWTPVRAGECTSPSLSRKERTIKRRRRAHHDDDGKQSSSSDQQSMEVESSDDDGDEDDAVEVAALAAKLREGYDKRQSVTLDSLSKESVLSLRQQVLDDAGDRVESAVSSQITSLITTSTSLKMVGYYLRAILAHRLKANARNCYKRLARETLDIKSPTDIAAYPALYDFVQHNYPNLGAATVEAWLENPIFTADMTWTEWKRYLTKPGRPIIDAALQQFKAPTAPFQDWMELGWVEVCDDEKLGGQGVRALRDIHMPKSKTKQAQRDLQASVSVVAADLHCAGPEFVKVKDPALQVDPEYLIQMDKERVFDARHHWIGKINHLPMSYCNLKATGNGKLVQVKPIAAGEALTWDYGMDYWVYQVTRLDASEWLSAASSVCQRSRSALFVRMHESVLDYSQLLQQKWARSLSSASSAVDREGLLLELEDFLAAQL